MEEVLASHPDVAECAVIGVHDAMKGQLPLGFLVLKVGVKKSHEQILKEVVSLVRERIGPVAAFKTATIVKRLRRPVWQILRGHAENCRSRGVQMPATIDDPGILEEIEEDLTAIGYAKRVTR